MVSRNGLRRDKSGAGASARGLPGGNLVATVQMEFVTAAVGEMAHTDWTVVGQGDSVPIASYSVLKGKPTGGTVVKGTGTHYQITVAGTGGPFTVAVNIQSFDGSEVLYLIEQGFVPPSAAGLAGLASGMTRLASQPGGLALDFVREQIGGKPMVTRAEMTLLPIAGSARHLRDEARHAEAVEEHALQNAVVALVQAAIAAGDATLYAFGSAFADSGRVDGIHDIHMNQGNPVSGGHAGDNGVWQDGALFVAIPGKGGAVAWTAVFLAFQTQSWTTDGVGNPE